MRVRPIAVAANAALGLAMLAIAAGAQSTTPLPAVHLHPVDPNAPVTAAPAQVDTPAPAAQTPLPADAPQIAAPQKTDKKVAPEKKSKKEKEIYSGPTEIVQKDPTPMLDEEGKQRVDTEGKPMFNPPVKQQRDKKGHPLFDDGGKPVYQTKADLGYDEHGKKLHSEKVKPAKMTPVSISRGTFTVDGVIGKAELNYDIPDLKYIYLYVPGMGITLVSNVPFPGAKEQKVAFDGKTLTVMVNDHKLQVAGDKPLLGKKPVSAFVAVDPEFTLPSKYPVVGYGVITKSPYAWPGSKSNKQLAGTLPPPPVPKNLQPVHLLTACAAGQMRMPAPPVLPGQVAPEQPCVPVAQAQAALNKMKTAQAARAAAIKAETDSTPVEKSVSQN